MAERVTEGSEREARADEGEVLGGARHESSSFVVDGGVRQRAAGTLPHGLGCAETVRGSPAGRGALSGPLAEGRLERFWAGGARRGGGLNKKGGGVSGPRGKEAGSC